MCAYTVNLFLKHLSLSLSLLPPSRAIKTDTVLFAGPVLLKLWDECPSLQYTQPLCSFSGKFFMIHATGILALSERNMDRITEPCS